MAITVGYDATAALRQAAGIGRYARELIVALDALPDSPRFRLFACAAGTTSGHIPPLSGRCTVRRWPVSDRVMNAVWHRAHLPLPVQCLSGSIDLFHSPDFTLPPYGTVPTVLTVHDLAFLTAPETAYPSLRNYLQRTVPASVRRATHVIAVSESTKRDVVNWCGVSPERVTTVYEGVSERFRPTVDRAAATAAIMESGIHGPYILAVGTVEPRKNYVRLFEAYRGLLDRGFRQKLVIAGRLGWLYEPILAAINDLRLGEHVLLMHPPDGQLKALYGLADAFAYPSLYEGFGIPPLEALACGVPVACSNAASLPEVVGDAALLFDPLDVDAMRDSLERLLTDDALRAALAQRGLARAATFRWSTAAEMTLGVYGQALHHG